ncbi:uncharacterized protein LY89DRAFT_744045 [Mollisia scopiformis]|uniref:C2H2-type domain-containing protein n=1 Tax=Mollisia scopiformis TaxID=149040 RepID=A0A132B1F2_MOLSC|nr:uncharacterized protein LY89DRAFT_744045 [Mollisia scopiformis]KUJ06208.1 hypothetical protein LY89DRAFT_744045 [Mollisia scopiformis]
MASDWPPSTAPSITPLMPSFSNTLPKEQFQASQMNAKPAPSQLYDMAGASRLSAPDPYPTIASNPSLAPLPIDGNLSLAEDLFQPLDPSLNPTFVPAFDPAFDPAFFDKLHEGRYWCEVLGCLSSFTRKADRDRHVRSWHNCATLHFCPVPGCKKSLGKPYSRKDKLQEHMQKKHPAPPQA